MKVSLGAGLLGMAAFVLALDSSTQPAMAQVPSQVIGTVSDMITNQMRQSLHEVIAPPQQAAILRAVEAPSSGPQSWQVAEQQTTGTVTPLRSFNVSGKQCAEVKQT